MNSSWRRVLSVVLTVAMVLTLTTPAFAASGSTGQQNGSKGEALDVTWEKVENHSALLGQADGAQGIDPAGSDSQYDAKDVVRVSILLSGESTLEKGYKISNIANDKAAQNYRDQLRQTQKVIEERISQQALGGKKLNVVWNLTLAANLISANVEYGKIDAIKNVIGVKNVVLEARYEAALASRDELDPDMSIASGMTGGQYAWSGGYTGAGTAVAIVDTGLDTDHQSFDPEAFEYAISESESDVALMDADYIEYVLPYLNASGAYEYYNGEELTVDQVYVNSKVPFAFNYVDVDLDITHDNDSQGEHGSHVAGIAAANRYIPDGSGYKDALEAVKTQGEAPDAQIIVMKVFGKGGGAYDSDYMAAIEDSIIIGAAATNLSLGSGSAGLVTSEDYQYLMDEVSSTDLVLVMSAGNSYSWADQTVLGYNYEGDKNFDTVGSPGSYTNTLAVASVDNDGQIGPYVEVGGKILVYTESLDYGNSPMVTLAGDCEYVYVDGIGADADADSGNYDSYTLNQFEGLDLSGKIAITNRGTSSFFVKANAAVEAGAAAVIIANNNGGAFGMNLTGYRYSNPVVSISQSDGAVLKDKAERFETVNDVTVYYGTLTVSDIAYINEAGDVHYTMSDFSSWGVPGDLSLKPEITAPGGNIYSVNGGTALTNLYENMSGTSMAAPQVTGLAALMAQYITENDLVEKTGLTVRQLTNSLLMSTAEPMLEEQNGAYNYYSVLKQGAGLARVDRAIGSRTYIMMDEDATASASDGKIKAELGEIGDNFSVGYTMYNTSEEDIELSLSSAFFTQDVFSYYTFDYEGNEIYDGDNPLISYYLDQWTTDIENTVKWYINGEEFVGDTFDINGDGDYDTGDAEDLLSYVVGNIDDTTGWNLDIADVDEDGDIDTHDAYLVLSRLSNAVITVPADGQVHIEAKVVISGMDDQVNGNYVEGYLFAEEAASADGALGISHSIPVLGYYGDWSASPMFDKGSYLEYLYGEELVDPYMAIADGEDAKSYEAFIVEAGGITYLLGGNPLVTDTDEDGNNIYLEERNAISGSSALAAVRYSQLRNAGAARFQVADESGSALFTKTGGGSYSAYYYYNGSTWNDTVSSFSVNYKALLADEGARLTYSYTLAPEYYLDENGEADWSALSKNATISISATVDNTAPEVKSITAFRDGDLDEDGNKVYTYNLSFDFLDNQYVAAVAVMDEANYKSWVRGQDYEYVSIAGADVDAAKGKIYSYELSYTDSDLETPEQLMVEVYDYALNETTYKVNLAKNTQLSDSDSYKLEFVDDEVFIIGNSSSQLAWFVDPWGVDDLEGYSISFESSDETIATVDENGLVTSVAQTDAECDITGTFEYNGITASAVCHVTIKFIDKVLNGVVWDEKGVINFSRFNLNSLPNYTRLSDSVGNDIASVCVDPFTGVTYAASFDSSAWTSDLYTVDEANGYALTLRGSSPYGFMDIAPVPGVSYHTDQELIVAVYGYYLMYVDAATGTPIDIYNLSDYTDGKYFVGIAYEDTFNYISYGYGLVDWYFLVDEAGNLYDLGLLNYNGTNTIYNVYSDGSTGYSTDMRYFNSLYLYYEEPETEDDEAIENLVWSCFNYEQSKVDMVIVNDIYGSAHIGVAGSFADGVWPASGLYESIAGDTEASDEAGKASDRIRRADAVINTGFVPVENVENLKPAGKSAVKGGTNAVQVVRKADIPHGIEPPAEGTTYTSDDYIYITADEDAYNGLIEITFDPEELDLYGLGVYTEYYDYTLDMENGKIVIGFISESLVYKNDVIALLAAGPAETVCKTELKVDTKEINNGSGTSATAAFEEHAWGEPVWTWTDDFSAATATFTCENCGETVTLDAKVTEDAKAYTATVTGPDGETYTDSVDKPAAYVMSYGTRLEGQLALLAHIFIPDDVLADDDAYVAVSFTNASDRNNPEIVTSKQYVNAASTSQSSDGIVRRVFPSNFFIAQLNDDVTVSLYDGEDNKLPLSRLVDGEYVDMTETGVSENPWAYLERYIAVGTNADMKALAQAIEYYGTAAQLQFSYHTDLLPEGAVDALTAAIDETEIDTALAAYEETTSGTLPAGISKYSKNLTIEGDHSLVYQFQPEEGADIADYMFWIDSGDGYEEAEATINSKGRFCVRQGNIASGELSKTYKFKIAKVGDETNAFEISASALSYAYAVTQNSGVQAELKTLVRALYLYSMAANKFFGTGN